MSLTVSADLVDDPMWDVLGRLPECLRTELEAAKSGLDLCYIGFTVGQRAGILGMADCKDGACGIAWVRLVGEYPSSVFPTQEEVVTGQDCGAPMVFEFEMGVARCAPRPQGRAMYPDAQAMFTANRLYMSDARVMKKAILCCLPAQIKAAGKPPVMVAVGGWTPLEEGAGLSGGTWQGFVGRMP